MKNSFYIGLSVFGIFLVLLALLFNPIVFGLIGFISNAPTYSSESAWVLALGALFTGVTLFVIGYFGTMKKWSPPSRRNRWLLKLIGIPICFLIFGELLCRVRPIPTKAQWHKISVPYVPSAHARHIIPKESRNVENLLGTVQFTINDGYHGKPFLREKPPGEIRIVLMGGSFVFSDHEPVSAKLKGDYTTNWVENVERKLHARGFTNVRVINAGVPGHDTFDSLGRYMAEIHLFKPDYLLICHAWNDIKYFKDFSVESTPLRMVRPLTIAVPQKPKGLKRLLESTQLWTRIKDLQRRKFVPYEGKVILGSNSEQKSDFEAKAVEQYELNLKMLTKAAIETDAVPIIITQPTLLKRDLDKELRKKIRYHFQGLDHDALNRAYEEINNAAKKVGAMPGTEFYDLYSLVNGNPAYFIDHVHLSAKGNEAVSDLLSEYLSKNILNE